MLIPKHDFIAGPTDTDSISFCKADFSPFTPEECDMLLAEINKLSPEFIEWEDDGYYKGCIALKAKNYVLYDGKKKIVKGSGFKTSSKEPAMKDLMTELVHEMLNDNNPETLTAIYHKFVFEATEVQDIRRWCAKKTITRSILDCEGWKSKQIEVEDKNGKAKSKTVYFSKHAQDLRMNEITVWEALKGEDDIQEGNKIYLYPTRFVTEIATKTLKNGRVKETPKYGYGLKLDKDFNVEKNDLDVEQLLKRCYNTVKIFSKVLNIEELFLDYSLTRNQEKLKDLLENV